MIQITSNIPVSSSALNDYALTICPVDLHIHIAVRGTWVSGDWATFSSRAMSRETTTLDVVRAWSVGGATHWTLEKWEHDNGYRCELVVLTKTEFLSLIRS